MNASPNINQNHDSTIWRRATATALMAMAFTASAVGLAATSHADPDPDEPQSPVSEPAPPGSWFNPIVPGCRVQIYFYNGRLHCG